MRRQFSIQSGYYSVHSYTQIKQGRKWKTITDEHFEDTTETVDEEHVNNIVNGYNPFSSREYRKWNVYYDCGHVYSYSPDGDKRHVWDIKRIGGRF